MNMHLIYVTRWIRKLYVITRLFSVIYNRTDDASSCNFGRCGGSFGCYSLQCESSKALDQEFVVLAVIVRRNLPGKYLDDKVHSIGISGCGGWAFGWLTAVDTAKSPEEAPAR